ncbi:MAG: nucleotidyltransferase substrate binding protein [Synechococcaceae cyanobacterium ELA182]
MLQSQANGDLVGSQDTLRQAFRLGLISDGATWMLMIQDRNLTSHTYNHSTVDTMTAHISGIDLLQGADRCPGRCQWCW